MNKLVIANLLHRPLRSLISITAVAIEVIMILSIVGIFMGMLNDQKQRTNGIGADLMMRASNTSAMNGVSGASMSQKLIGPLSQLPHVKVVAPGILQFSTAGSVEILYGIDFAAWNALKPFVFLSGGPFQGPNDVIVDDVFAGARSKNPTTGRPYAVGDSIQMLNNQFRICGIVEHGHGGRKLIPITTMGELTGAAGKASLFYIKLDDPTNNEAVIQEIHEVRGLHDYPVETMAEWLSEMTPDKLPGFNLALDVVTGIAVIVGFLVIFQSMYTAVLERTREIGILKSLGAGKLYIVNVVLRETLLIGVGGIVLGILFSYAAKAGLKAHFQTLPVAISYSLLVKASVIALIGSLLGAFYPAIKAAQKDPIDALAYE